MVLLVPGLWVQSPYGPFIQELELVILVGAILLRICSDSVIMIETQKFLQKKQTEFF